MFKGVCGVPFTFPKWGKGDRGAVDEDVEADISAFGYMQIVKTTIWVGGRVTSKC